MDAQKASPIEGSPQADALVVYCWRDSDGRILLQFPGAVVNCLAPYNTYRYAWVSETVRLDAFDATGEWVSLPMHEGSDALGTAAARMFRDIIRADPWRLSHVVLSGDVACLVPQPDRSGDSDTRRIITTVFDYIVCAVQQLPRYDRVELRYTISEWFVSEAAEMRGVVAVLVPAQEGMVTLPRSDVILG